MINVRAYSHQAKRSKIKDQAVVFGLTLKYDIFDTNNQMIKLNNQN